MMSSNSSFTLFCLFLSVLSAFSASTKEKFSVAFQWNYINYTWPSPEALSSSSYIPGEDVIAGIKIYKDIIYLALPRVKRSARVTLASLPIDANKENPLLSPFPSWEMNSGSTCDTIQNALSMEIDKAGIMWVLDARRVDNNTDCPPKIVLLDLNDEGRVVQSFEVPDDLCPHRNGCFLNDIVVDGDYAYMSDTTASDPGIFIFNRQSQRAWKARDKTMVGDPEAANFTTQGVVNSGLSHINGIALSCGKAEKTFFYMPQSSFHIYSISNLVLQNPARAGGKDLHKHISNRGTKRGQSGGMIYDNSGHIYYGLLPLDAVAKWDVNKSLNDSVIVEQNHEIIRWPDSFSIYGGQLYLITNSMGRFGKLGVDVKDVNFRIIQLQTNTESYIQC